MYWQQENNFFKLKYPKTAEVFYGMDRRYTVSYTHLAEGKFKRLERKQSQIRLENLFKSIEAQDPSICKLALG